MTKIKKILFAVLALALLTFSFNMGKLVNAPQRPVINETKANEERILDNYIRLLSYTLTMVDMNHTTLTDYLNERKSARISIEDTRTVNALLKDTQELVEQFKTSELFPELERLHKYSVKMFSEAALAQEAMSKTLNEEESHYLEEYRIHLQKSNAYRKKTVKELDRVEEVLAEKGIKIKK